MGYTGGAGDDGPARAAARAAEAARIAREAAANAAAIEAARNDPIPTAFVGGRGK